MNNNTFKIDDKEYKILKILTPSNSDKKYLIYTDDNNEYYASYFEIKDKDIVLNDIHDEKEWKYIDERMEEFLNGK